MNIVRKDQQHPTEKVLSGSLTVDVQGTGGFDNDARVAVVDGLTVLVPLDARGRGASGLAVESGH